jgi:RNA polymerase subunit RPABC4/transcription elongation factor Spt4
MHCGRERGAFLGILRTLREEHKEAPKQSQPRMSLSCPECGHDIIGAYNWCPRCGSRIVPFHCDYCQGIIPRDAVTCPRCGAPAV